MIRWKGPDPMTMRATLEPLPARVRCGAIANMSLRPNPIARALARRIAASVVVLLGVSVLLFAATAVLPGDPATRLLGLEATPENLEAMRRQLGLDKPVPLQYADWLGGVLTGDMGNATSGRPVGPLLRERASNSLILAVVAASLTVAIALVVGVASGLRVGRPADSALSVGALVGVSIPDFVVAGVLISLFAFTFEWFPPVSLVLAGAARLTGRRSWCCRRSRWRYQRGRGPAGTSAQPSSMRGPRRTSRRHG